MKKQLQRSSWVQRTGETIEDYGTIDYRLGITVSIGGITVPIRGLRYRSIGVYGIDREGGLR